MGQGKKVTVSDSAGIDAVKVDDIAEDAMYDLYGRRVSGDTNALSSGLYVRLHNGVVFKNCHPLIRVFSAPSKQQNLQLLNIQIFGVSEG